jgi:DNA-binding transcriptional regulator GbsR (MarR family)
MKAESNAQEPAEAKETLARAREQFVSQWGAIGSTWGITRTMAMIHALLLTSAEPLSTDQIMEDLRISRGNANTNLRDLVGWGLIRIILRKGERKEYFEAEKDIWKMLCIIAQERKRRELIPAMGVLKGCAEDTKALRSAEAREFHQQMQEISKFIGLAEVTLNAITASKEGQVVKLVSRLIR